MRCLLVGLLAALYLLAGCSGADDRDSADAAAVAHGADLGGAVQTPDELAMSFEDFDGELRLGLRRPSSYLPNELVLTDQSAVIVSDLLYDGLTEAVGRDGVLRPALATEWWANDDFTVWTFRLDPSSNVSAGLVVDSLTPLTGVAGTRRAGAAAILAANIASVAAIGDETISIQLRSSNAGLPWVLSGLPFSVVGVAGAPTGDYEVTTDDTNGMILGRRDSRPDEPVPAIERVIVTWTEDAEAAEYLLGGDLVDAVVSSGPGAGGAAAGAGATSATRFYVLNPRSELLADVDARRAVLAAIDRAALVDVGADQELMLVDGLVGSTMAGFRSGACDAICQDEPEPTDQLRPSRLQLSFAGDEQRAMAAAIVGQLIDAGIAAEQNELVPQDLAAVIVDGETDMFSFGWVAAATSIDAVVPPLLAADSPANVARVDSPIVAGLLEQAAVIADDELRWEMLDQAHRAALSEALILPVAGSAGMLRQSTGSPALVVRADGSIDLDTTS